jgi:hypothetical protein
MPPWLTEALKHLGFATPLIYASATYGLFHFLDKKASGQAKRAILGWLRTLDYDKGAIASALIEIFDRLYTKPLLGWRALLRSASFTLIITFAYAYWRLPALFVWLFRSNDAFMTAMLLIGLVISDYLSLFVVRRWLVLAGRKPITALLTGPIIGVAIIIAVQYAIANASIFLVFNDWLRPSSYALFLRGVFRWEPYVPEGQLLIPAFVVHLWLVLFAFGVLFIRALNLFFSAVGWTQWFIKQGQHHPLQAIGYVAGGIVLIVTVIIQSITY